ncbi:unnamed protein product [Nyctereutes procyonoides]|uniref:(raccoon dog) hypothetical protein n=1 Tax=Nyctereutes procyonoides TaxID=34880 RepID=A0A811Y9W5_NYCPR|nr:unnamed protein product [Nyctereutes procyonoides]
MINIHTKTSVPDHTVWSLDWGMAGDMTGAQAYMSTTKCLHIWALVLGLLLIIMFIIISAH